MPIPFSCPFCSQETLVDDEYAGQSGACATCGKKITVPYLGDGAPLNPGEIITGIPYRSGPTIRTIVTVTMGTLAAAVAVVGIVVLLLFPAFTAARSMAHTHTCDSNLKKIGAALLAYEAEHGSLPPAFVPGPDGKPMHSWRVLILPYLDEQSLYNDYDFSQPWDSLGNQRLSTRMPSVFACPADDVSLALGETNYMVIVGPTTPFPANGATMTHLIADDLDTTILVAEVPVQGVAWLEPKDLDIKSMQFRVNGNIGREIGSHHRGGAHAVMADGQVRFLTEAIPEDYIQGMTTQNGAEVIPWDALGR